MRITFSERFALPADEVFSYFASPADWSRLYGFSGVRDLGSGWFAVGIEGFPYEVIRRPTIRCNRRVHCAARSSTPVGRAAELRIR